MPGGSRAAGVCRVDTPARLNRRLFNPWVHWQRSQARRKPGGAAHARAGSAIGVPAQPPTRQPAVPLP